MDVLSFVHDVKAADLPTQALHEGRRCLLDLIGVAASGRTTPLSRIVHDFAVRQMGASEGGARLLFDSRRASAAGAAYAGASTIDSFDAHDGHPLTKGHAGVALLPALLAVIDAERLAERADGREFLATLVMGYEVAIRAGIALHRSVSDYHTSGAWNALGCAAIASRLLRLDRETTRHALGTSEYHGPRSQMMRCIDYPTMLKDGSGWGAFVGVSAAYLAQDGFTGAPAVTIEAPEQGELWGDLGSRWRITEQYLKPWPVCRWAQPAIEAAAGLIATYGLRPSDIAAVEVETFAAGVALGTAPPRDTESAQYALGFPLAAFLVRGSLAGDTIAKSGIDDPAVRVMLTKISLRERPQFTAAFPETRQAVVHITRRDGTAVTSPVTRARGDADRPLSDDEVLAKFGELMRPAGTLRTKSVSALIAADTSSLNVPSLLDLVTAPLPKPPQRAVA